MRLSLLRQPCYRFLRDVNHHRQFCLAIICVGLGILSFLCRESTSWAQDKSELGVSDTNQAALSNDEIEKNEARLKRLEEELLKTLDASSKSSAAESSRNTPPTSIKMSDVKASRGSIESQPSLKPVSHVPTYDPEFDDSEGQSLKELEQHPALQPSNQRLNKDTRKNLTESDNHLSHRLSIAESQVEILSRELDSTRKQLRSEETSKLKAAAPESVHTSAAGHIRAPNVPRGGTVNVEHQPDNEWVTVTSATTAETSPGMRTTSESEKSRTTARLYSSARASVAVDGAPLRIGPGKQESALYLMPRHTEVRIEHRTGEWYRVTTDAGTRGWLWSGALIFDTGVPSTSTVRVGGFRAKNEPAVLRY